MAFAKYAAQRLATHRIGCCTEAAEAVFGRGCVSKHASVLYCGVDLGDSASTSPVPKESIGIPRFATTIGCVANLTAAKNHLFLLSVFGRILQHDAGAHLLLVGEGPNKAAIEKQAAALGIRDRVHLLGHREDVPALLSIFDVFVLPSFTEGLPISLLEAQANGIPCLTSTAVTREVEVVPGLVKFLALNADLDVWARTAIAMARCDSRPSSQVSRDAFERSSFNISCGVTQLTEIYLSQ